MWRKITILYTNKQINKGIFCIFREFFTHFHQNSTKKTLVSILANQRLLFFATDITPIGTTVAF